MEGQVIVKCFIILISCAAASMVLGNENTGIDEMCDQTPNSGHCKTLLIQHPTPKPIGSTAEFLKVSMERTLDGAVKAKSDTYSLGAQFESRQRGKGAWEDCMELYDQAIHRLNQSVSCPKDVCSRSDVQAWLSTALTNLETCREGMSELGVSSDSLQGITIDVSNALAIIKGMEANENGFNGALWISKVAVEAPSISRRSPDAVVAQDGSGDYKTIQEAVDGAGERPRGSPRYVIHVKGGVYEEYVNVGIKFHNLMIVGDGIGKTIITGDKSKGRGFSTFKSATFVAEGDGFVARDITIRNTAGPENNQAVALRSDSDRSVYYRCSIQGYQDTLYVHSGRQFFRECNVYGTVDFIFGNAAAVFQNCSIFARRPPNRVNTITAQNRVNPNQTTGIVIQNSVVRGAPGAQLGGGVRTYLGRPWGSHARTVVMGTFLGPLIEPRGWMDWDNETKLTNLYYGEYRNSGPGSDTKNRVNWAGFHVISDIQEARQFTLPNFIDSASPLPKSLSPPVSKNTLFFSLFLVISTNITKLAQLFFFSSFRAHISPKSLFLLSFLFPSKSNKIIFDEGGQT